MKKLVITKGTYGSNQHPCYWLHKYIDNKKLGYAEYLLWYNLKIFELNQIIEEYLELGFVVEFQKRS